MQIFKNFLLACSVAIATSPVYLQAADNDAQTAARAALEQKMRELKGAAAVEAPAAPIESTAPKVSEPVMAPPAAPARSFTLPQGASPDLIEQARQATRARMAELQGNRKTAIPVGRETPEPQPTAPPVNETAPSTNVVAPATTVTPTVTTKVKSSGPTAAEIREAKAREAAERKAERARIEADAKAAKAAKQVKKAVVAEPPVLLTPLVAPASSLPPAKEQALQALTEQYKADKITAEEYHDQRAKILAEP